MDMSYTTVMEEDNVTSHNSTLLRLS